MAFPSSKEVGKYGQFSIPVEFLFSFLCADSEEVFLWSIRTGFPLSFLPFKRSYKGV